MAVLSHSNILLAQATAQTPAMEEIGMEWVAIDLVLTLGAAIILSIWVHRCIRSKHWSILSNIPDRTSTLSAEHMAFPILCFITTLMIWTLLFPETASEDGHAILNLAGSISALLIGGVACLLVAHRAFEARIQGFLFHERNYRKYIKWSFGGLMFAIPLSWIAAECSIWGIRLFDPHFVPPQHEVLTLSGTPDVPAWVILMSWFSALCVAPFAEEAFFRGILQSTLRRYFKSPLWPLLCVSLLFGLAHADQPHAILPLAILGWILGFAYEKTGALMTPVLLHMLFNFRTMIYFSMAL